MNGTCSTHGDEKLIHNFSFKTPKGRNCLRDNYVRERIILKETLKKKSTM
jgi:hypothetical protein